MKIYDKIPDHKYCFRYSYINIGDIKFSQVAVDRQRDYYIFLPKVHNYINNNKYEKENKN